MSRIYSVEFEAQAVTAAVDLFELVPATDKPIRVWWIRISQSTEVGDAAEEQLILKLIRGHATSGSGGGTPTPAAVVSSDPAAAFTAESVNTTIASVGTPVDLHVEAFNVRTGFEYLPIPELRPQISAADSRLVLRLASTPADSIDLSGTIYVEEM
jgi:hypothetical protein